MTEGRDGCVRRGCVKRRDAPDRSLHMEANRALMIFPEDHEQLELLTDKEFRSIYRAMMAEHTGNPVTTIKGRVLELLWPAFRSKVSANRERWETRCRKNSENGKMGGRGKKRDKANESERFSDKPFVSEESQLNETKLNETKLNSVGAEAPPHRDLLELTGEEKKCETVRFDAERAEIVGIPDRMLKAWRSEYGECVDEQIRAAGLWLAENPKRMKKDFLKFLGGWLRRNRMIERERGGRADRKPDAAPKRMCEAGGTFE